MLIKKGFNLNTRKKKMASTAGSPTITMLRLMPNSKPQFQTLISRRSKLFHHSSKPGIDGLLIARDEQTSPFQFFKTITHDSFFMHSSCRMQSVMAGFQICALFGQVATVCSANCNTRTAVFMNFMRICDDAYFHESFFHMSIGTCAPQVCAYVNTDLRVSLVYGINRTLQKTSLPRPCKAITAITPAFADDHKYR